MATKTFRGDATAVAQVDRLTIGGTLEADDILIATINGKALSVVAGSTVLATAAATFIVEWNNSTVPEFAEITATDGGGGVITLTADTKGKPFIVTASTTETGGGAADLQTFVRSAVTASSGPNHWDTAANWSASGVPASTDDVTIARSAIDILYGLDQSAVTLASLTVEPTYTGKIGLPTVNADATSYFEYRDTYLKISATLATINTGGGRTKLNTGTNATTLTVNGAGVSAEINLESVHWIGVHASNAVNHNKGSLGIGVFAGEAATLPTLRQGYITSPPTDATCRVGSGVTLTTVTQLGGTLQTNSALTTLSQLGGTHTHAAGAIGTANVLGGTLHYTATATATLVEVSANATLDLSRDMRGRTISACNIYAGATIRDPNATATWTAGIDLVQCGLEEVTLILGENIRVTRGVVA